MKITLIRYGKSRNNIKRKDGEEVKLRETDKAAEVEWEVKLQSDGIFIQTENNCYHCDLSDEQALVNL